MVSYVVPLAMGIVCNGGHYLVHVIESEEVWVVQCVNQRPFMYHFTL